MSIKQKFEKLSPEHQQVLIDIQKSVPLEWTNKVTKQVPIAPVSEEIMKRAIQDPDVSDEDKKTYQAIIDSGFFNKKIDEEQLDIAELINAYVEKEILKAVAQGRLPKIKRKRSFEAAYRRFNKLKEQYETKTNKEN